MMLVGTAPDGNGDIMTFRSSNAPADGPVVAWVEHHERGYWTRELPTEAAAWSWVTSQVLDGGIVDFAVGGQRRIPLSLVLLPPAAGCRALVPAALERTAMVCREAADRPQLVLRAAAMVGALVRVLRLAGVEVPGLPGGLDVQAMLGTVP